MSNSKKVFSPANYILKIPLEKSKHILMLFFCSVRFRLPYRLIPYKWAIHAKHDAVIIQLSIFWNAESKLKRVPSSLKSHTRSLNPVHRGKILHIIWIASDIITWIKSVNLVVRSLGGPQKATTIVVIIPAKKWGYVEPLQEWWVNHYERHIYVVPRSTMNTNGETEN